MHNKELMPVIIKKYPHQGLPPIEFNTFELGEFPSKPIELRA